MPKYELKSDKTGKTYKVETENDLNDDQFQSLVSEFDKPHISAKRLRQNLELESLLGDKILDPETGLPAYSDEQRNEDLRNVRLEQARKEQAGLQRTIEEQEELSKTGNIESAAAGAALIPASLAAGVASLGQAGLEKSFRGQAPKQLGPLLDRSGFQKTVQTLEEKAAVNPYFGGSGSALTQTGMMGGAGGVVQKLGQGAFKQAGKEYLKNAGINLASGETLRSLVGQETSPFDIGVELAGSALGGKARNLAVDTKPGRAINKAPGQVIDYVKESLPVRMVTSATESTKRGIGYTDKALRESLADLFTTDQNKFLAKAIRPSVSKGTTMPELAERFFPNVDKAAQDLGIDIVASKEPLRDTFKATNHAINQKWGEIETGLERAQAGGVKISTNDVADEMVKAGNNPQLQREVSAAKKILQDFKDAPDDIKESIREEAAYAQRIVNSANKNKFRASAYRGEMTPTEAEGILQTANANLEMAYARHQANGGKLSIEDLAKTDPELAQDLALAIGIRKKLDDVIDLLPGKYSDLKKDYGALVSLRSDLSRRVNVEERQRMMGIDRLALSDVTSAKGLLKLPVKAAVSKILKQMDSSDEMMRRAFQKYREGLNPKASVRAPVEPLSDLEKDFRLKKAIQEIERSE